MRRSIRFLAPLFALLILAPACSDDSDDSGASNKNKSGSWEDSCQNYCDAVGECLDPDEELDLVESCKSDFCDEELFEGTSKKCHESAANLFDCQSDLKCEELVEDTSCEDEYDDFFEACE